MMLEQLDNHVKKTTTKNLDVYLTPYTHTHIKNDPRDSWGYSSIEEREGINDYVQEA